MNDLPVPTKPEPPSPTEVRSSLESTPSWRELRERFSDLMRDIGSELREVWEQEGKGLRREAAARLIPALKRTKGELEKLLVRLEERVAKESEKESEK